MRRAPPQEGIKSCDIGYVGEDRRGRFLDLATLNPNPKITTLLHAFGELLRLRCMRMQV